MDQPVAEQPRRKDLQDLSRLSRAPVLSYLQKQSARYPTLAEFSVKGLWGWISEYLANRIGPRHRFQDYTTSEADQKASFFCLENDHWRIIALDTGYNSIGLPLLEYVFKPDCALPPELMHWLSTVVQPRPDDPRGTVLLSHHQYYSQFDQWYPK